MTYSKIISVLAAIMLLALLRPAQAQTEGDPHIIQLSGVVVPAEDSLSVLPGVHIYVPKAGRGTTTNGLGFFSMPVLPGDSIIISTVGYRKQSYIVPDIKEDRLTKVFELHIDTTYLPELTIFPYPTEELFKEAVLALEMPDKATRDMLARNLSGPSWEELVRNTPMDGGENFDYYQQLRLMQLHQGYGARANPLLNPFNWMNFIQSLKRDKEKDSN